jgi:hypothetical protein
MAKWGTNRYEIQASQARYDQNVQDIQTFLRRKSDISVIGLKIVRMDTDQLLRTYGA